MANRLAQETSPYLLQHAHNPVDWFPWGQEAFSKARLEDKPIFLSVGYATCHWCHVMERESFEDPEVAALINQNFVPIKVDREELPDVDQLYMAALQAMTGSGGWPMSMFLTPELKPFFGGTYFPPQDRHGMPSFRKVLSGVRQAWQNRRGEVIESALGLTGHLSKVFQSTSAPVLEGVHERSLEACSRAFDPHYGGFSGAPKFPQSPSLLYLLSHAWLGNERAWEMLDLTLRRMAEGGIYDQVGGGFHRYAVDGIWRVPHFEKMLYDNAQLARVYAGAHRLSGEPLFRRVATETLDYLLSEMSGARGEFFSAQDADSEGVEGKYYVWTQGEVKEFLGPDAQAAIKLFGVSEAGNWEGVNVLESRYPEAALQEGMGLSSGEFADWRNKVREKLYQARKKRIPPPTDDKVLADWNGLALRAFAEVGRLLGEERYLWAARRNAEFVSGHMFHQGLLRHTWRAGKLRSEAYLSDQANYGLGLLELFQATGEARWLTLAQNLAEGIIANFQDPAGGFFDSLEPGLPVRPKDSYDGPYPSGNAATAELLFRLSALMNQAEWRELVVRTVDTFSQVLSRSPLALPALLQAHLVGTMGTELALPAPSELPAAVNRYFLPLTTLITGPKDSLPLLQGREAGAAYLCQHGSCRLPATSLEALKRELRATYPGARLE